MLFSTKELRLIRLGRHAQSELVHSEWLSHDSTRVKFVFRRGKKLYMFLWPLDSYKDEHECDEVEACTKTVVDYRPKA
jgi:hypothetical protein